MKAKNRASWIATRLSCRFRLPTEEGPDICTFKESSPGRCKKRGFCPLAEKFGGVE